MPKDTSIRKVLVIGSGPIVIGQAAEFDYAGAQACRVLKAEGVEVVLVNSNPATIMTDTHLADEIYLEPMNAATLRRIIAPWPTSACGCWAHPSRPSKRRRTGKSSGTPWRPSASPASLRRLPGTLMLHSAPPEPSVIP